jgi:hypothetical protein
MKFSMSSLLQFVKDGGQDAIYRVACRKAQDVSASGIPPSQSFPTVVIRNPSGLVIPDGSYRESIVALFRWPQADDGRE